MLAALCVTSPYLFKTCKHGLSCTEDFVCDQDAYKGEGGKGGGGGERRCHSMPSSSSASKGGYSNDFAESEEEDEAAETAESEEGEEEEEDEEESSGWEREVGSKSRKSSGGVGFGGEKT